MSDIKTYAKGVKSLKVSDIKQELLSMKVSCTDIINNINLVKSSDIDLEPAFNKWYLTAPVIKAVTKANSGMKSLTDTIAYGVATSEQLINNIEKVYLNAWGSSWDASTINSRQVNILNLMEHIRHFLEYSNLVLMVGIYMTNGEEPTDGILTKAVMNELKATNGTYTESTLMLLGGSRKLIKELGEVKEIEVDDSDLEILASFGEDKPKLAIRNFGIHALNPYFWVSSFLVNVRLRRIENARRKNELFAMKIAQAVNQRQRTNDASLDHRIEVYQNEIIKNQALIAEIEAKYA